MMTVCEEMKKLRQMLDEKGIEWHDKSEVISKKKTGQYGIAEHTLNLEA